MTGCSPKLGHALGDHAENQIKYADGGHERKEEPKESSPPQPDDDRRDDNCPLAAMATESTANNERGKETKSKAPSNGKSLKHIKPNTAAQ